MYFLCVIVSKQFFKQSLFHRFLEYMLIHIYIHTNITLRQCSTCFALLAILGTETSSKYEIKNHLGQRVYFAVEENDCFDRNLCSPIRSFTIRIADNMGREVITVNRPLRCNSCWFPCFLQEVSESQPPFVRAARCMCTALMKPHATSVGMAGRNSHPPLSLEDRMETFV